MFYNIPLLPPQKDLESKIVLKKLPSAHRRLAELKGVAATIPNESILINTLALQEAKDSSAIENIITTHDELYKAQLFEELISNASAKEVNNYAEALKHGFDLVRKNKILTTNHIIQIQQILEQNDAGFRKVPGTELINQATGESIYTPPQEYDKIVELIDNMVKFMNDSIDSDLDPLIKMAVIHHQFESIHPFYDGNGRTGRILNILYLVVHDLLDLPILYLSGYIIKNKADYYRLLQKVRDTGEWEEWIVYMLNGIEQTAKETIVLISQMRSLMQDYKMRIRKELPKVYSQDLLNNIFRHPYTKIEFVMKELMISRLTASKYTALLVKHGFLKKEKIGRSNFYINVPLFRLFKNEVEYRQQAPPIQTINPIVQS
ncbi:MULTISPECIES: Fic family protein [unclassified Mucilaginibacter]|uniref:Fic family protein n=1 Tax=unclassified Mucilaginibacter TaxID=2617802 RepID=UPI002AC9317C|nr:MULTISPECIES: Fic family protein [unclassified Mucilaginibacter]MEB0263290.1 Fic family protein [Mucilaginibacter sp. 10I4]MEB0278303.1 Fic family protein [Mucilaginibacter sp. 10B2]MEB0301198.1 Fic family protein [Mucilaginibacter sp. 5C4]WPX23949.1 Fic family protein [Mucilaginibacter sp. 5C4]